MSPSCTKIAFESWATSVNEAFLNTARLISLVFGKSPNPQTIRQWFSQVNDIQVMEDITAALRGRMSDQNKNGRKILLPAQANVIELSLAYLRPSLVPSYVGPH